MCASPLSAEFFSSPSSSTLPFTPPSLAIPPHQILSLQLLAGVGRNSVVTASRDGRVNLWDTRSDCIASTLFTCPPGDHILCMDYLPHAGILVAGGTEG